LGRRNAYTYTDTYTDFNTHHHRYCDCNSYNNSYIDCYPNTYSNIDSYSNTYPNADPDTNANAEIYSHAEATPESNIQANSATAPDTAAAASYEYTRCNGAANPTASHYTSAAATFTATYSGAEALTGKADS
jgi:hypothetical protein